MKIERIAHAAYKVHDLEASKHFYCDLLGAKVKFNRTNDKGEPWITYLEIAPLQFLELFYDPDNLPEQTDPRKVPHLGYQHLCLQVDDIRALAAFLTENGFPPEREVRRGRDKSWQIWVLDPDNNPIEVHEYTPESDQLKD